MFNFYKYIFRLDTLIKDESIEPLESKQIDKKADISTSSKESKDKATAHNKPSKTRTNDFKKTHRRSVSCPIIQVFVVLNLLNKCIE